MKQASLKLEQLAAADCLRTIPGDLQEGMTDLSSNDYLSLGADYKCFLSEYHGRFGMPPMSSSASRLLGSHQRRHRDLEDLLGSLYGKDALLFNSGYHANVGCIGALTSPQTLFLIDRLVHASVYDGLAMAGSRFKRFRHNDTGALRRLLADNRHEERIVVAVESVYSMKGDRAPIGELVRLKEEYPQVLLYVDEAHAFGVFGDRGLGLAEQCGIMDRVDIIIGTLGKAAASVGAFAATAPVLKSLFVNQARSFIFSTAIPPANAAWSQLMVEHITGMKEERRQLRELSSWFSAGISAITGKDTGSESQIVPFTTGSASSALRIAEHLRRAGYLALPIRRPTVPPGEECIRFSLCAGMTRELLIPVLETLKSAVNEI